MSTLRSTPLTEHDQFPAMLARLQSGEAPAAVARAFGVNEETVRSWWKRNRDDSAAVTVEASEDDLDAELDRALAIARKARDKGLVVGSINIAAGEREGSWDGWRKDAGDDSATSDRQTSERRERSAKVTVKLPANDTGPNIIRQAEPVEVNLRMPRPPKRDKGECRTAFIFPDIQFPFHDAAAVDVAEQLAAYVEQTEGIDDIIWLGDDLDFPEVGKHRSAPGLLGSMQDGIELCYQHKARVRAISPEARAFWLQGNHEQRLVNWLVDNAVQLIGLRRAGDETEPVLSVEFLCRTAELNIEVVGPYPEGRVFLTDSFKLEHGRFTGPHPEAKYLGEMEVSTVYGHTHRAVLSYREVDRGPRGLRSYFAGSPGCLARLDGELPSTKSGIDANGRPGRRHAETWQQGVMVVRYNPSGGELPDAYIVRIINGTATWEGRRFVARCDIDGNVLDAAA